MLKRSGTLGNTALLAMTLAAPLPCCGQVRGSHDGSAGSGGQGGEGGRPSAQTGAQVQASAGSSTSGTAGGSSGSGTAGGNSSSGTGGVGQGGQDPGCD